MKLKGHEKFPLREGWLDKGIRAVHEDNRIFTNHEGADRLGVGTNMVKSIRYWLQSFELIEESQRNGTTLTKLAELIEQYDEYFEDYFTLWILHSHIAANDQRATAWYLFFNKCSAEEFRKEELFEVLKKELIAYAETNNFPDNSLKDDIDVILNMYSKNNVNSDPEDKNKSPLAALGLVKKEKEIYYKTPADLRKFKNEVVLYELAKLFEQNESVSIETLAVVIKNIYNINRVVLNRILDIFNNYGYIKVDRTAGLDMIYPVNIGSSMEVVEDYYNRGR